MDKIIGQKSLVEQLKKYSFNDMPNTLLFIGEKGAGKHFISSQFAEYLGVDLKEINNQTTSDQLTEYYQNSLPMVYLIDLTTIAEKQQHKYLKFIEEPSSNMKIILIAESEIGLLPTILNRCIKYNLAEYTVDQLKQFSWAAQIKDDIVFKLCTTPGQLLSLSNTDILKVMQSACSNMIKTISNVSYSNFISNSCKINFKEEYNKFDFELFFKMLIYTAYDEFILSRNEVAFTVYTYLIRRKQQLLNKTVAKEAFIINTLDEVWRLVH